MGEPSKDFEGDSKKIEEGSQKRALEATRLGLKTKSGLRPNSKIQGLLIYMRAAVLTKY